MAEQMIYKKMSDVMKSIGAIGKTQTNSSQGYKFRGIDNMINALYPALCKHDVVMIPECAGENHDTKDVTRGNGKQGVDKTVHLFMKYHFVAEDGSRVTVGPIPSEGLDSGDKATNKALSAALKYALIQTFCIPTEDMEDGDSVSPERSPELPKTAEAPKPSAAEQYPELPATDIPMGKFRRIGKPAAQPAPKAPAGGSDGF